MNKRDYGDWDIPILSAAEVAEILHRIGVTRNEAVEALERTRTNRDEMAASLSRIWDGIECIANEMGNDGHPYLEYYVGKLRDLLAKPGMQE